MRFVTLRLVTRANEVRDTKLMRFVTLRFVTLRLVTPKSQLSLAVVSMRISISITMYNS
jgi:hypothetical protein